MKTIIIIAFFTILNHYLFAQKIIWPVHYGARWAQKMPIVQGYLITTNGDTINGFIKLIPNEYPILPFGKKEVIEISIDKISQVTLKAHSVVKDSYCTNLIKLNGRNFWRLLVQDGSISIYDNVLTAPSFVYGTKMILVSNGSRKKIYSMLSYLFHNGNISRPLVRFIKKTYNNSSDVNSKLSITDLIQCILDKEKSTTKQ
jgi:hypothetical protein